MDGIAVVGHQHGHASRRPGSPWRRAGRSPSRGGNRPLPRSAAGRNTASASTSIALTSTPFSVQSAWRTGMLASAIPSRLPARSAGTFTGFGQRGDDEGVLLHRDRQDLEGRPLFDGRRGVVGGRDADECRARDDRRLHRRVGAALEERDLEPFLAPTSRGRARCSCRRTGRVEPRELQRDRRLGAACARQGGGAERGGAGGEKAAAGQRWIGAWERFLRFFRLA
jgi:hypothetical protein